MGRRLAACLLLLAAACLAAAADDVLVIEGMESLEKAVKENDFLVLEMYAPCEWLPPRDSGAGRVCMQTARQVQPRRPPASGCGAAAQHAGDS